MAEIPKKHSWIEIFASSITKASGSNWVIISSFIVILLWVISGPFFNYSADWHLIINTGTSVITFLMVFLIQKAQSKDYLAIQIKLNELLASHEIANTSIVNIENMSEEELQVLQKYYSRIGIKNRKLDLEKDLEQGKFLT